MTPYKAGDWQHLAEHASRETNPEKLRWLVQLMIYALAQEQMNFKHEIQSRLDYRFTLLQSGLEVGNQHLAISIWPRDVPLQI